MTEVISNNSCYIIIKTTENSFTIYDSYKIVDDELKKWFIEKILERYPYIRNKRTFKSIFNEWKLANCLYKKTLHKDMTINLKQTIFSRIIISILSKLIKEK